MVDQPKVSHHPSYSEELPGKLRQHVEGYAHATVACRFGRKWSFLHDCHELNPAETLRQVQRRKRELSRFQKYLIRANSFEFDYDSLLDADQQISDEFVEKISTLLDHPVSKPQIATRKISGTLSECIENLETDIRPVLNRNKLGYLCPKKPSPSNDKPEPAPPIKDQTIDRVNVRVKDLRFERIPTTISRVARTTVFPENGLSEPVFVISAQESGANILRPSLATCDLFTDTGEIFHPMQGSFWDFRKNTYLEAMWKAIPNSGNQISLF